MRKFTIFLTTFLAFLLMLSVTQVSAQTDITGDFPDITFANAVRSAAGLAPGAPITDAAATITDLIVSDMGIVTLSGLEFLTALETFDCSGNPLAPAILPALPNPLTWLNCSNTGLTTLPGLPNLTYLDCSHNALSAIPSLPGTLLHFDCSYNPTLPGIPALTPVMTYFNCSYTGIPMPPAIPGTLEYYLCAGLNSTDLTPVMSGALIYLDCSDNQIAGLPAMPGGLQHLDCSKNLLPGLAPFPGTLTYLDCSDNQIIALPDFPELTYLNCSKNLLTGLPTFPGTLLHLDCSFNQLTELPTFSNLTYLDISNNQIIGTPYLPNSLIYYNCSNNQLTGLNYLKTTQLTELNCSNNFLTALPILPSTLENLDCSNNNFSGSDLMIGEEYPAGTWNPTTLPAALLNLDCSYNYLTGLNVSSVTALQDLNCIMNYLGATPTSNIIGTAVNMDTLPQRNDPDITLDFVDLNFRAAVRVAAGLAVDAPIYASDVAPIKSLNVSGLGIGNLAGIEHLVNLMVLNCSDNLLGGMPALPTTLAWLDCSNNNIAGLPNLTIGLQYLNCSNNALPGLPEFPGALTYLDCSNNQLPGLPILPGTLVYLNCSYNQITDWNGDMPLALTYLNCSENQLTALPDLPALDTLICNNNDLAGLPILPGTLVYLDCSYNQITDWNGDMPILLTYLNISNNLLPGLPWMVGLSLLEYFDCSFNQLSALPLLPGFNSANPGVLAYLVCNNNQLVSYGDNLMHGFENPPGTWNQRVLPNTLEYINCMNNQLTALNVTGLPLTALMVSYNNISCPNAVKGVPASCDYSFFPQNVEVILPQVVEAEAITPIGAFPEEMGCSNPYIFGVTTIPGCYEGTNTMVLAIITMDPPAVDSVLVEYLEANSGIPNDWRPLPFVNGVASYGPPTGFPLVDATSQFRVTNLGNVTQNFDITVTISIVEFDNQAGAPLAILDLTSEVLALPTLEDAGNVTVGPFVLEPYPAIIACGQTYMYGIASTAGCYAGAQVIGKVEIDPPSAIDSLLIEYWENNAPAGWRNYNQYFVNGVAPFGPTTGFAYGDATSPFRVTNKGNAEQNFDVTVIISIVHFDDQNGTPLATVTLETEVLAAPTLSLTPGFTYPTDIVCGVNYDFGVSTTDGCYAGQNVSVLANVQLDPPAVGSMIEVWYWQENYVPATPEYQLTFAPDGSAVYDPMTPGFILSNATSYFRILNNGTATEDVPFTVTINLYDVTDPLKTSIVELVLTGANLVSAVANITTLDNAVCPGFQLNMTATPAGGIWESSNPAVATIDPVTGVLSAITLGSTDVTYTYAAGDCFSMDTKTIQSTNTNTITLTSAPETEIQVVSLDQPIEPITYVTTGATEVTVSGLPQGVTSTWISNVVTISGTPTESGIFIYTVLLDGGCGPLTATGKIKICEGSFTDAVNNQTYEIIALVGKCWFKENLKGTLYQDGSKIPFAKPYDHPVYPNVQQNIANFGLLYNYFSANPLALRSGGMEACPAGWRIPTVEEWSLLSQCNYRDLLNPLYWITPNEFTNKLEFDIRAAGFYNNGLERFEDLNGYTAFWTSEEASVNTAYGAVFRYNCMMIEILEIPKANGISVRCIEE